MYRVKKPVTVLLLIPLNQSSIYPQIFL